MTVNIKVIASGVIALCLMFSALFYMQSVTNPQLQAFGDKFFGLAVVLVIVVTILAFLGIKKINLP